MNPLGRVRTRSARAGGGAEQRQGQRRSAVVVTGGSGIGYDFQQEQIVAAAETFLNRSRFQKQKALPNSLLDKALRNGR